MNSFPRFASRFAGLRAARWRPARVMALAGAVLLLIALQAWAFQQSIAGRQAEAHDRLLQLQQEAADHRLLDGTLQALQDYWRAAGDAEKKREALALRDIVLENLSRDPRRTVDRLVRAVPDLDAGSPVEREALEVLLERGRRLRRLYADHYTPLVNAGASPAWYFLPAALLVPGRRDLVSKLQFNRAVYLMLTGEYEGAARALGDLLPRTRSSRFRARVLYAQARLHYESYRLGSEAHSFTEVLELTRQSTAAGPGYAQAGLFLDFLLGVPPAVREVDAAPVRGTGTGEGEAERGTIVTGSDDF